MPANSIRPSFAMSIGLLSGKEEGWKSELPSYVQNCMASLDAERIAIYLAL